MKRFNWLLMLVALGGIFSAYTSKRDSTSTVVKAVKEISGKFYVVDPNGNSNGIFDPVLVNPSNEGVTFFCDESTTPPVCYLTVDLSSNTPTWDSSEGLYYFTSGQIISHRDGLYTSIP